MVDSKERSKIEIYELFKQFVDYYTTLSCYALWNDRLKSLYDRVNYRKVRITDLSFSIEYASLDDWIRVSRIWIYSAYCTQYRFGRDVVWWECNFLGGVWNLISLIVLQKIIYNYIQGGSKLETHWKMKCKVGQSWSRPNGEYMRHITLLIRYICNQYKL